MFTGSDDMEIVYDILTNLFMWMPPLVSDFAIIIFGLFLLALVLRVFQLICDVIFFFM